MYMLHYDPFREIRRFQRNRGLLGVGSFGDDAGRWQLPLDDRAGRRRRGHCVRPRH